MNVSLRSGVHKLLIALCISLSVSMLTGCGSSTVNFLKPEQQNLLTRCSDSFDYVVTGKTGAEWTRSAILWRSQYEACAARHNRLIDVIEEYDRND